jgi:HEAT repeat protein/energy-coupling factor transporter ATP-binding protein EcfA2
MVEQLIIQTSSAPLIDWSSLGRVMLKQSMAVNPLSTHPDVDVPKWQDIQISLGWVNRQQEEHPEVQDQELTQEEFFEKLFTPEKNKNKGRRCAIIGHSGLGKTTLLQKIAQTILEQTEDIPIWISLSDISRFSLRDYLQQKWLERIPKNHIPAGANLRESFQELLQSGRVWLLLDGLDTVNLEPLSQDNTNLETQQILFHPLVSILQQLQSFAEKSQVVLTSRHYVWEMDKSLLHNFDIYYPLGFRDREEVKQFIKKWFQRSDENSSKNTLPDTRSKDLAEPLCQALENFGLYRLQSSLLKNPLHLALICQFWQKNNPNFPTTQASLYRELVREYYCWQAEKQTLTQEQQQQLNQALGNLALQALQGDGEHPWLTQSQISDELGEYSPLGKACLRLGWLKLIGVSSQNSQEKIYTFFDEIFLNYFAALSVADLRFFLPKEAEPSLDTAYPVFEQRWQRAILLWWGREDITEEQKEEFITALLGFQDGCSPNNYYGKRAFYVAALGLTEFSSSRQVEPIIERLITELLGKEISSSVVAETAKAVLSQTYRPQAVEILVRHLLAHPTAQVQRDIFRLLERIGKDNSQAVEALVKLLTEEQTNIAQWQGADCLGKISPGHPTAVDILVSCLEQATKDEERMTALQSLEKVGKGNAKAITALVRQLIKEPSPSLQRRIFAVLEKIAANQANGVANLVQLIRSSSDLGMRRQAAETLEKIDPSNPTAIAVLVQMLKTAPSEEVRQQVVYSLGEIAPGNGEVIQALVDLIKSPQMVFTQWVAITSIGKIGYGSPLALNTLSDLIQSTDHVLLRKDAIESLSKIDPDNPVAIRALVQLLESTDDEATRREAAESLGKIDPGNPEAIEALTQLLHNAQDEFTRRQAAASLGKIDSGNLEALSTLIKLTETSQDADIRSLAAESIGEIGRNNPAATATLIQLLQASGEDKTIKQAAKSLGKIGGSHPETLKVLVRLLVDSGTSALRIQAAESLIALLGRSQMGLVVSHLRSLFADEVLGQELASHKILWHCVQKTRYPEFYHAWHKEETVLLSPNSKALTLLEKLPILLSEHPQIQEKMLLLCIDSGAFVDPENPLIDIYDQLLAQGCPPFEHGLPDSLPKLKLYWHTLCRHYGEKTPILLFWENPHPFSSDFLKALAKFQGSILTILQSPVDYLPSLAAADPQLLTHIVLWLNTF